MGIPDESAYLCSEVSTVLCAYLIELPVQICDGRTTVTFNSRRLLISKAYILKSYLLPKFLYYIIAMLDLINWWRLLNYNRDIE